MKRLIGWLHSVHLNCRSDLCHSSALCPQLLSMALKVRLQIIYMACNTQRGLPASFRDHFFCHFLFFSVGFWAFCRYTRLIPTLGPVYLQHPFRNSPFLQANPSLTFYLCPTHLPGFSTDVISSGKCLLTLFLTTKPSPSSILSHSIFYFSA